MQQKKEYWAAVTLGILAFLILFQGELSPATAQDMDKLQRRRMDQIISIFENETPEFQYGYVENLHDGRGITAGRAGFTTATGDLLMVLERYTALKPNSPLKSYLPRLRELAAEASDDTTDLQGLEDNWSEASYDKVFRAVQDQVVEELYYKPALTWSKKLGVKTPLGLAILYDTAIQHGLDPDPDSLPSLISLTNKKMKGCPKEGVEEVKWLEAFLQVRHDDLTNATDPETREVWAASVGRVDALAALLARKNTGLQCPLCINPFGKEFVIR